MGEINYTNRPIYLMNVPNAYTTDTICVMNASKINNNLELTVVLELTAVFYRIIDN